MGSDSSKHIDTTNKRKWMNTSYIPMSSNIGIFLDTSPRGTYDEPNIHLDNKCDSDIYQNFENNIFVHDW